MPIWLRLAALGAALPLLGLAGCSLLPCHDGCPLPHHPNVKVMASRA
ncbi:MAG: hypothetical protein K2W96_03325 [Gemmataceae bacterium]|nr:hypothetical protein [Gemmataceae bacterium]